MKSSENDLTLNERKKISAVIPCRNEQENIGRLFQELTETFKNTDLDCEILFIDDGSSDQTLKEIKKLAQLSNKVFYISFSKNFGKEAAIYAGIKYASGDYITIMDADLQDPPSYIPQMLDVLKTGEYDCAATYRTERRGEPKLRSALSRMYYPLINKISEIQIHEGAKDFRTITRKAADAFLSMNEYNRFSRGLFEAAGLKTFWIKCDNIQRAAGTTKWSTFALFKYALNGIISFTKAPLILAYYLGALFTAAAAAGAAADIFFLTTRNLIPISLELEAILLIGGLQFICMGFIGSYTANIYMESKKRPLYIISSENISEKKAN